MHPSFYFMLQTTLWLLGDWINELGKMHAGYVITLWSESEEEGSATESLKRLPGGVLEQTKCMQERPEPPRLRLSLMQTQLSQSGSLPSAHFLYLALRKAEGDHCPAGASMPEMLSALTQTRTCTYVHQCIPNMQHRFQCTHRRYIIGYKKEAWEVLQCSLWQTSEEGILNGTSV